MSEIGSLVIKLRAETAELRDDLGKVKQQLGEVGDSGTKAGQDLDYSMREARGSMMLVGDVIGVHLPREINTMIASVPAIGAALSALLPIMGAVFAVGLITKMVEKQDELAAAFRKVGLESQGAIAGLDAETHGLTLAGLKLDDVIAKLQNKPTHNYVREAIEENIIAMDNFVKKSTQGFADMDKDLADYTAAWGHLHEMYTDISNLDINKAFKGNDAGALAQGLQQQLQLVAEAQVEYNNAAYGTQAYKDALDHLKQAQQGVALIAGDLANSLKKNSDDAGLLLKVTNLQAEATAHAKQSGIELANASKRVSAAHIEQAKVGSNLNFSLQQEAEYQKLAAQGAITHADALRRIKEAKDQGEGGTRVVNSAQDQQLTDDIQAANDWRASRQAIYEDDLAAAVDDKQKQRMLGEQWANDQIAYADKVALAQAESQRRITDATLASIKARTEAAKQNASQQLSAAQVGFQAQAEVISANLAKEKGAIQNSAELGLISRREAIQEEIALIQKESGAKLIALTQEVAAKRKAIQEEIDLDNSAANKTLVANHGNKSDPAYIAYLADAAAKQTQLDAITTKYGADVKTATTTATTQVAGLNVQLAKLFPTWQQFFQEMNKDMPTLAQGINGILQSAVTKFNDSFSQGMAKSIVESKSLSAAMRKMGQEILEDAISSFIKWRLMNAEKAGAAEFTNAISEGAPMPVALGMAAGAFAKALAFEQGGKIPGSGAVPIIGHGGETVVTKALTDRVERSESHSMTSNGGATHVHANFSPQVHAMDAEGVDRVLTKHGALFQRHLASTIRRMNR